MYLLHFKNVDHQEIVFRIFTRYELILKKDLETSP
jgi:hypothetical protein